MKEITDADRLNFIINMGHYPIIGETTTTWLGRPDSNGEIELLQGPKKVRANIDEAIREHGKKYGSEALKNVLLDEVE